MGTTSLQEDEVVVVLLGKKSIHTLFFRRKVGRLNKLTCDPGVFQSFLLNALR